MNCRRVWLADRPPFTRMEGGGAGSVTEAGPAGVERFGPLKAIEPGETAGPGEAVGRGGGSWVGIRHGCDGGSVICDNTIRCCAL